jgi:hypothetical protein
MDLKALSHLRIKATTVPDVQRVRLPRLPWRIKAALREREALTATLEAEFPFRALWLSDWASDDAPGWRVLAPDVSLSSFEEEFENGAWALFFFRQSPDLPSLETHLQVEPADACAAVQVLRELGALGAIWSWYDNCDWLIAVPSGQQS